MYKSKITAFGEQALDFLSENMLILFAENAPSALAEIAVLHSADELKEDIVVGDRLRIGSQSYKVTAVGSEVNHTFRTMGHCTLKFDGRDTADLPGVLELSGAIPDIKIGDELIIEKQ